MSLDQPDALTLVLMTAPDPEVAERLARALVEEALAACATVLPGVSSIYRWQGEVRTDAEAQVLLKTRRALVPELFRRAAELHPYEVPELLAVPAEASVKYGAWVREMTVPPVGGRGA
jgi:periplasmic divalent cation tolerance protein